MITTLILTGNTKLLFPTLEEELKKGVVGELIRIAVIIVGTSIHRNVLYVNIYLPIHFHPYIKYNNMYE